MIACSIISSNRRSLASFSISIFDLHPVCYMKVSNDYNPGIDRTTNTADSSIQTHDFLVV